MFGLFRVFQFYSSSPTLLVPTLNNTVLQVTVGNFYERIKVLNRINSYEVRQVAFSNAGFFNLNWRVPFAVKGNNGCKTTIMRTTP